MVKKIPLCEIHPPAVEIRNQQDIDSITELAESIKAIGLLQPILVRKIDNGYEVIAGHRRYLAHIQLGEKTIEAKIIHAEEEETVLCRVHENLFRLDITPLEEAQIVGYLHYELKWETAQIQQKLRKSKAWIETRIDIFHMPEDLKQALEKKLIPISVSTELMKVDDELKRKYFLDMAVHHGATWRQVQQWRVDFNQEKFTTEQGATPSQTSSLQPDTGEIFITCYTCSHQFNAMRMMSVNICQGCWTEIYKAKQNPLIASTP